MGLLVDPDVSSIAFAAGRNSMDSIMEGIVNLLQAGAEPLVTALSVRDWAFDADREGQQRGPISVRDPSRQRPSCSGTRHLFPQPGVSDGMALVGDPRTTTLLVREGVQVFVSDSDSDNLIKNMLTVLGEGAFDLMTEQPKAWCKVDLAASGSSGACPCQPGPKRAPSKRAAVRPPSPHRCSALKAWTFKWPQSRAVWMVRRVLSLQSDLPPIGPIPLCTNSRLLDSCVCARLAGPCSARGVEGTAYPSTASLQVKQRPALDPDPESNRSLLFRRRHDRGW